MRPVIGDRSFGALVSLICEDGLARTPRSPRRSPGRVFREIPKGIEPETRDTRLAGRRRLPVAMQRHANIVAFAFNSLIYSVQSEQKTRNFCITITTEAIWFVGGMWFE